MAMDKKVLDNWFASFSALMEENQIYMDARISRSSLKVLPDPEEASRIVDNDIDEVVSDPVTRAKATTAVILFPNKPELVTDELKEGLYQLSRENRLVIARPQDKLGNLRVVRTDEENRLYITPEIDVMAEAFETRNREGIGLSGFSREQYNRFAGNVHNLSLIQRTITAAAKREQANREAEKRDAFIRRKPELSRLLERLKKTDSRFSNDSDAYKDLRAALNDVMHQENPQKAMSAFLSSVQENAGQYLNEKKELKSLSRRQIERLRIINQILDLGDQISVDRPAEAEKEAKDRVAEKLVMAIAEGQVGKKRKADTNPVNDPAAWQDALTDRDFRRELIGQIQKSRSFKALVADKSVKELDDMLKVSRKSLLARTEKLSEKTAKDMKKNNAAKQKKQDEPHISL